MLRTGDHILQILVLASLAIALLFFLLSVVLKLLLSWRDKSDENVIVSLENLIVNYLVDVQEAPERVLKMMKKLLRTRRNKDHMIELLIKLSHNFSGIHSERTYELYEKFHLHKHSLAKFRSPRWHLKVRGMYELSTLEYEDAYEEIAACINHRQPDVRRNARVSLVKIRKKEALLALKDIEGTLSEWAFINIMATLKRHPSKLGPADLDALMSANNPSIKALAKELETTVYVF